MVQTAQTSAPKTPAPVNVAGKPVAVAASADGRYAYDVSARTNTLTIVDTLEGKALSTAKVGSNPVGVVLSPTGTTAYVAYAGKKSLAFWTNTKPGMSIVNLQTQEVANLELPSRPVGIATTTLSNGDTMAFITGNNDNVMMVNLATNKLVRTFKWEDLRANPTAITPLPLKNGGVAYLTKGSLFGYGFPAIESIYNNAISGAPSWEGVVHRNSRTKAGENVFGLSSPTSIAAVAVRLARGMPDGDFIKIFVGDDRAKKIKVYSGVKEVGNAPVFFKGMPEGVIDIGSPVHALVVGGNKLLYAATDAGVKIIDVSAVEQPMNFTVVGTILTKQPRALAMSNDGKTLIVVSANNTVSRFDLA